MRLRPAPSAAGPRAARPLAWHATALACAVLAACSSTPRGPAPPAVTTTPQREPGPPYATDGPLPNPPPDLIHTPNPEPRIEPVRAGGPNKPYQAAGEVYVPISDDRPLVQKGLASWYGRKFHGRPTASGELYNMYALTAAHPTLPIPSYARVRNPANGREVIVRVNDRGPFSKGRIVDLSYTAALKLDVLRGVAPVELERITHEDIRTGAWRRDAAAPADTAVAAGAEVAPGTPVRARELWGQELALAAPAAGVVRISTRPQPLPQEGDATAAVPPAPLPLPAQILPTPMPAPTPAPNAPADAQRLPPTGGPAQPALPPAPPQPARAAQPVPAAAAPEATAGDPARTAAGRGWWLQVGAFRERGGALQMQRDLAHQATWLAPLLALFDERGLHKLQLGPFPSRAEAVSALQRVKSSVALTPLLVERR